MVALLHQPLACHAKKLHAPCILCLARKASRLALCSCVQQLVPEQSSLSTPGCYCFGVWLCFELPNDIAWFDLVILDRCRLDHTLNQVIQAAGLDKWNETSAETLMPVCVTCLLSSLSSTLTLHGGVLHTSMHMFCLVHCSHMAMLLTMFAAWNAVNWSNSWMVATG